MNPFALETPNQRELHSVKVAPILVGGTAAGAKCFLHERVARCAHQPAVIVRDDPNGHIPQQRFHSAFIEEGLHEFPVFHFLLDLGGNGSTDKNSAGRHVVQGTVPGFRSEHTDENRHCLLANGCFAFERKLRNQRWGISRSIELLTKPGRFFGLACVAKKFVDAPYSRARENSFATDAAVFLLEVDEQFSLYGISRSEVRVSALAGEGMVAESIPIESGHA